MGRSLYHKLIHDSGKRAFKHDLVRDINCDKIIFISVFYFQYKKRVVDGFTRDVLPLFSPGAVPP